MSDVFGLDEIENGAKSRLKEAFKDVFSKPRIEKDNTKVESEPVIGYTFPRFERSELIDTAQTQIFK